MNKLKYQNALLLLVFFLYASIETGCSSENKIYGEVPFNRVTLIKNDTIIQFYTKSPEKSGPVVTQDNLYYTWYRADSIFITKGAFNGKLLDGSYLESFPNKALKQKGNYKDGLKDGIWETWFQNGERESLITWKKGIIFGKMVQYTIDGKELSDTIINKL